LTHLEGKAVIHQIDYDLRQPGRNYDPLYAAIKTLGSSWAHPLKSAWAVDTHLSAAQVRDELLRQIDQNDGLLVTRLQGEAAWHSIPDDVAKWFHDHLG
jgi:hypothetical protein